MAQTDDEKVFQQPHDGQYSSGYVFRGVMSRKQRGPDRQKQCGKDGGTERKRREKEKKVRGGVGGTRGGERERETERVRDTQRETERLQRQKTERDRRNNIKCIKRARYELTGLHTTPQKGEGQAEKEKEKAAV